MARVEMYVKSSCPFCIRAARLLEAKGVAYEAYEVGFASSRKEEMVRRAGGRTTVPQIFIDDRHVGGCDDLFALERQGRLDRILAG